MAMEGASESLGDLFMKVGVFVLVQVLVYLILSNSSSIFSSTAMKRSQSFRSSRSVSLRRILAALSDMPPGGEPSPTSPMPPILEDKAY